MKIGFYKYGILSFHIQAGLLNQNEIFKILIQSYLILILILSFRYTTFKEGTYKFGGKAYQFQSAFINVTESMSKLKNPILLESVITISSFLLSPFTGCQVYKLMPEIAVKQKLYQPFILCTSPHSCGKKSQESQKQLHQPHCILSSLYLYTFMSTFSHLFRDPQFWLKYYFEYL